MAINTGQLPGNVALQDITTTFNAGALTITTLTVFKAGVVMVFTFTLSDSSVHYLEGGGNHLGSWRGIGRLRQHVQHQGTEITWNA